MKQNKRKFNLSDRPLFGAFLLIASNALAVAIVVILNRFVLLTAQISSRLLLLGLIIFALIVLIMNLLFLATYINRKRIFKILFISCQVIFLVIASVGVFSYYRIEAMINGSLDQNLQSQSTYVVVRKNTTATLNAASTVGLIESSTAFESSVSAALTKLGYSAKLVQESSYANLLNALLDGSVDLAILPENYETTLTADASFYRQIVVVDTIVLSSSTASTSAILSKPFTLAIFGTNDGLPDSIMLVTFNPNTLKVTITSVPRDSYVPITCDNNRLDKLNHSATTYGLSCTIDTIQNMLDIKIDYYADVNFNAVVALVDALGGLEVEVDHEIIGDYSPDKSKEPLHTVVVPAGKNVLTGEQVLTFVRERYSYAEGDFARQKNQQYVLQLLVAKLMSLSDINTLTSVLGVASDNVNTSLSQADLLSLMSFGLEQTKKYSSILPGISAFRIEQSRVTGVGDAASAYSPAQGSYAAVVYVYKQAIIDTHTFITQNLRDVPALNDEKTFAFDSSAPYSPKLYYSDYYDDRSFQWE